MAQAPEARRVGTTVLLVEENALVALNVADRGNFDNTQVQAYLSEI